MGNPAAAAAAADTKVSKPVEVHVKSIFAADNPAPGGFPARVTYCSYRTDEFGLRVVRLETPTPSVDDVEKAVQGDLDLANSFRGLKFSITPKSS